MQTRIATNKKDLIHYFLQTEGDEVRSVAALSENLNLAMKQGLNSKELAIVLYHATFKAKQGIYGEDTKSALREIESHIQTWTDKTLAQSKNISPYTLTHMWHAFSLLNIRPPQRFIDRSMELANDALIGDFNSDDASYFLDAHAKLSVPVPKTAINLLNKRLLSISGSFSPEQAYRTLNALTTLDAVNQQHFGVGKASVSQICSDILKEPRFRAKLVEPLTDAQQDILALCLLWLKGESPIARREENDSSSLFEKDVKENLEAAGAKVDTGAIISKLKHRIDLRALFNDKSILIECDGPSHFIKSADDQKVYLNGQTILQTALIKRSKPDDSIIRIPHDVFYQHMRDQDFWESFLINADDAPNGAYILDSHGLIELEVGKHSALQNE